MSKNRFEQLIEYVINDEEAKARELFHDIVVAKSREIYESLMDEEAAEEIEEDAEEIEEDDAMGRMDVYDDLGGDASDKLIDSVEADETMEAADDTAEFDDEAEEAGDKFTHDIEDEHDEGDLEGRVVKLEDELDALMAEFESMMDDGDAADAMDTPDMTDTEVVDTELETEGLEEAISLKAAPKPVTTEEGGTNTKSTTAANSGARGAMAKPVAASTTTENGRAAPTAKDIGIKAQNEPAQSTVKLSPATKPTTAQASGVNTKTPFPKA